MLKVYSVFILPANYDLRMKAKHVVILSDSEESPTSFAKEILHFVQDDKHHLLSHARVNHHHLSQEDNLGAVWIRK